MKESDMSTNSAGADTVSSTKAKKSPWSIVFGVALTVLIISIAVLLIIWFSYFQGQQKYQKLSEYFSIENELKVDWDALRAINPDIVAWVYVPGTAINYPVVRGEDNEYYLTHDFDGDQGWLANYGAIFMDYRNNPNWSDNAYFIYGHHMNDGSMFADVAGLRDQEFFDRCRTVYLLSPTANFTLRTYALIHCPPDDPIVQPLFGSPEEMAAYVQDKINRSVVDPGSIPQANGINKSFAFATCDNVGDARYVLFAYITDTSADDLKGNVGLSTDPEGETELTSDLEEKTAAA